MDLVSFFNQGWLGFLLGILGLVFGYFSYKRGKRDPHISFERSTKTLISGVPKSLKTRVAISIDGIPSTDLLSTRLVVWNSGSAAVTINSFPQGGELLIKSSSIEEILGFDILKATNSLNHARLKKLTDGIAIEFNYFNPRDGIIIDILHGSRTGEIYLDGVLLGQQNGISYEGGVGNMSAEEVTVRRLIGDIFYGSFGLIFGFLSIKSGLDYWDAYSNGIVMAKRMSIDQHQLAAILSLIGGTIFGISGLYIIFPTSRQPPNQIALPKDWHRS